MIESPLLQRCGGYVDGAWCDACSGRPMAVHNPATGEVIRFVPVMGRSETERAVESAARALAHPASIAQRRDWIGRLAELIQEHRLELGRIITHEHGKPLAEAAAEADYAASFFRYYAACVDCLRPQRLPARPGNHSWTIHFRPAGVAALITPWNFPLAMGAKKLSAALAADCCCVMKPSSQTPLSMVALFALMEQLELPRGKCNLVLGPAGEISDTLCKHPEVRVISFTGSTAVGKELAAATAPHLKRLSLELGGNAPFLVFEDADLDHAIDHLMSNKFRGAGQTCVCANRVYVQQTVADEFARRLKNRVDSLTVGNGMQEGVQMGPLIDGAAVDKVRRHLSDALARGAWIVAGARPIELQPEGASFFPPTVLRGVTEEMQCVQEETFGPLVPLLEFATEVDAIQAANATTYGLAAYVFTANEERAQRVISRLRFGHVGHNTGCGPTAEAPFGGMKQSGFGREGGMQGLHDFIEPQTVPGP